MTLVSVRVPLVVAVLLAGWCGVARAGDGRDPSARGIHASNAMILTVGNKQIACRIDCNGHRRVESRPNRRNVITVVTRRPNARDGRNRAGDR